MAISLAGWSMKDPPVALELEEPCVDDRMTSSVGPCSLLKIAYNRLGEPIHKGVAVLSATMVTMPMVPLTPLTPEV